VAVLFKETLRGNTAFQHNGKELYTMVEKTPEDQRRFEAGGKAKAFLEAKAKKNGATATVRHSGLPDCQLNVKTGSGEVLMGQINGDRKMVWEDMPKRQNFGVAPDVLNAELRTFRSA
ncbi:unnamed protein product, partial [Prorocentrum cordatum]